MNRLAAVIDVGSSSIRMAIAEVSEDGAIRTVESLQQSVSLGKDVFMHGYIRPDSIEAGVKVLRSFRRLLHEFQIDDPAQIRAVATSAVREASNRDAFLDRLYIATGIDVEPVDEAEVNRLIYLSVFPMLQAHPALRRGLLMIAEVGGGSTEIIELQGGRIREARTYRLGTMRLHEMIEEMNAPDVRARDFLKKNIDNSLMPLSRQISDTQKQAGLLLIGGEARFTAMQVKPEWDRRSLVEIDIKSVSRLADEVLGCSEHELVGRYHISYPEAESIGPCLMAYNRLAKVLKLKKVWVGDVSLRDGMLREMAAGSSRSAAFEEQVLHSAREVGKKYQFDHKHARHVTDLALQLFDVLQPEHRLDEEHRLILHVAGLLHDIGAFISNRSHHKHSMYLINNSDLFGLGMRNTRIASLVARYHRRAMPRPSHSEFQQLDRSSRIAVVKLAAMLRVADALDRGHNQRIRDVAFEVLDDRLIIHIRKCSDLTLERQAMEDKGRMFEEVFGRRVQFRAQRLEV